MGKQQQSIVFFRMLGNSEVAPILCKLPDPAQRNSVLAAARNLQGSEYDRVFVRPDLSADQREDERKLRQERDSRNLTCGEGRQRKWWRIRDSQLVSCPFDANRVHATPRKIGTSVANSQSSQLSRNGAANGANQKVGQ